MSYSALYNDYIQSTDVAVLVSDIFAAEEVIIELIAFGAISVNVDVFAEVIFDGLMLPKMTIDVNGLMITDDSAAAILHSTVYILDDADLRLSLPADQRFLALPRSKYVKGYDRLKSYDVTDHISAYLSVLAVNGRDKNRPVTTIQVNNVRNYIEVSPISVALSNVNYLVDCTEKADIRFQNAILHWALLGITQIPWTMADNTVVLLTEQELTDIYTAMLQSRALRALSLHQHASLLKSSIPTTTVSDIELSEWSA